MKFLKYHIKKLFSFFIPSTIDETMAKYTVRIELHKTAENSSVYEILHDEMKKKGFTRTIKSTSNKVYYLPSAEYNIKSSLNIDEVTNIAWEVIKKTNHKGEVLVTEVLSRRWRGLDEADELDTLGQLIKELED